LPRFTGIKKATALLLDRSVQPFRRMVSFLERDKKDTARLFSSTRQLEPHAARNRGEHAHATRRSVFWAPGPRAGRFHVRGLGSAQDTQSAATERTEFLKTTEYRNPSRSV